MKKIVFCCLVTLLAISCTVKKRSYTKGYYVDWAFKSSKPKDKLEKKETIAAVSKKEKVSEKAIIKEDAVKPYESENEIVATQLNEPIVKKRGVYKLDEPCGDLIKLKNGETVNAKVIEITDDVIKYRRCDNLTGPLISVSKENVFSIKYSNGNEEIIKSNSQVKTNKPQSKSSSGGKKTHPLAIVTIALAGASVFIFPLFAIAALCVAPSALRKIRAEPNIYEGEDLVRIGKIISWVVIGIMIFVLLFILLVFALLM
jgi:hypothetical protein